MRVLVRGLFLTTVLQLPNVVLAGEAPAERGASVTLEVLIIETVPGGERIEGLDAESAEAVLARVRELKAQHKPLAVTRMRLATLEHLMTSVQTGETAAVESGRQFRGPGRGEGGPPTGMPVYTHQNFGTVVTATTRIEEEGTILAELSIERTGLARPAIGEARPGLTGEAPVVPRSVTLKTQSTVRLKNGVPEIVQGIETSGEENSTETIIVVTAKVGAAGPQRKESRTNAASQPERLLKIFRLAEIDANSAAKAVHDLLEEEKLTTAIEEGSNSLLVRGTAEQLETIETLIRSLDAAAAESK